MFMVLRRVYAVQLTWVLLAVFLWRHSVHYVHKETFFADHVFFIDHVFFYPEVM